MKNLAFIFLVIAYSLLSTSCKFNKHSTSEDFFNVAGADSLSFTLFSLDTTDAACKGTYKNCPSAKFTYPVFNSPDSSLNAFLNAQVYQLVLHKTDSSYYSGISDYLSGYFNDNNGVKKQGNYDEESSAWEIEKKVKVFNKKGKYLTLEFDDYFYEGGAHPNSNTLFKTFDLVHKKQMNADELFINMKDTALLSIGEKYFRKDNEIADTATLSESALFIFGDQVDFEHRPDYGKFRFNHNYALTSDGIKFLYNAYEIGPYTVGAPGFTIPYAELRPFLKVTVW